MKWVATGAAWLLSTAILAPMCYFAVLVLAGPHGGVLPEWTHRAVLVLAWVLLVGAPVWIARVVYQRQAMRELESH